MSRIAFFFWVPLLAFSAQAHADGLAYKRILIGKIGMDRPFAEFDERLHAEFGRLDADNDAALTHSDVAAALNYQVAQSRAANMEIWLRNDLDGDLNVTAEELLQGVRHRTLSRGGSGALPPPEEVEAAIEKRVSERLEIDTNADGTVSLQELKDAANAQALLNVKAKRSHSLPGDELDLNCDGSITEAEFVSVFREVYEIADLDGSGQISRYEYSAGLSRTVMDAFVPSGHTDACDTKN